MKSDDGHEGRASRVLQAAAVFLALCSIFALGYVHIGGYSSQLMVPDEFGYITAAAFLAGHDWSGVTQGLPWYSFGYSLVLLPAFLVLEPEAWYRGAQLVNGLLLLAIVPMLVATVRRSGVEIKASVVPWVAALLVLLYPSVFLYSRLAASETLVLAATLVIALLVHRAVRRGLRWFDVLVLGACCASLYFIHSRLIATIAAAFLVVVAAAYAKSRTKDAARTAGVFIAGMVPVMLAGQRLKYRLIADLYGGQLHGEQHSLVESVGAKLRNTASVDGLVSLLSVGAGQVTYLLVSTLGIAALGVFWSFRQAAAWRPGHPERQDRDPVMPVFLLLNLALALAVSAIALSLPAFPHHVFYGRYTEPAMLPLFAVGIAAVFSGEVRWRWLLYASAFVFALLAPAGMKLAASLPAENTYWILISGLFTFRGEGWRIDYPLLFGGFAFSATVIWLCFRINRWAGVGAVAALLGMASVDLVSSHRGAGTARQVTYAAVTAEASSGRAPIVYEFDQDNLFMRTEVQFLNPRSRVVMSRNDAGLAGSVGYEVITKAAEEVSHAWCANDGREGAGCIEVVAAERKFELKPAWSGDAAIVAQQVSAREVFLRGVGTLPFVRSLDLADSGVELGIRARWLAGDSRGIRLVTFVTPSGQPSKWLNDVREPLQVPIGGDWLDQQARVSLLAYGGIPIPPGDYEIHIVLQHPSGYLWGTMISAGLKIESER